MKTIRNSINLLEQVKSSVECSNFGSGWCCVNKNNGYCCNK